MLKLSFVLEAVDRATNVVRRIDRTIGAITAPARRAGAAMRAITEASGWPRIAAATENVSKRITGLMHNVHGLRSALLHLGVAAAIAVYPLQHTIDEASKINDTAAMLGTSARELQRLSYALTLDGSSMEDAGTALRFLQRNAVEAVTGNQEMAMWFRRAGISAEFLRKNIKDPTALVYALANGMSRTETPGKRLAILQALLGRSSGRLAQTMSRGSSELRRLGDEAESLGAVLDEKTVVAMDDAGDALTRMHRAIGGVMAAVTAAALPVFQSVAGAVIEWTKANRALLATRATEFFTELQARLPAIWQGTIDIATAVVTLARFVNAVAQVFGGWANVANIVAAVLIGKLVVAIGAVTLAVARFGIVLLTTPLGWFLLGIGAIAGAAYLIIKNWEPIKQFFKDLWSGVTAAFAKAIDWISDKVRALTAFVQEMVLQLDDLTPEWVKRLAPGGMLIGMMANNIRASRASTLQGAGARTEVGGKIRIEFDNFGRPRARELSSTNRNVDIEIGFGPILEMAR